MEFLGNIKSENKRRTALVLLSVVLYQALFFIIEGLNLQYTVIYHPLDDLIPFNEYFMIPYIMWFFYLGFNLIYYIRNTDRSIFNQYYGLLFGGMVFCLIINVVWPSMVQLRPTHFERENIFIEIVKFTHIIDTPTNVCPSIHVYATAITHMALARLTKIGQNRFVYWTSLITSVLILMSTVFLKQHSIIDVIVGLFVAQVLFLVSERMKNVSFENMGLLLNRRPSEKLRVETETYYKRSK